MSKFIRIISKLECKGLNLIKGINFDGQRILGLVKDFAKLYYKEGIDELIYLDTVASLYKDTVIDKNVKEACQNFFIPSSCGGGIKSVKKIKKIFNSGADKVILNTQAIKNPNIINETAKVFGSQSIAIGVDVFEGPNGYEVWVNYGRENTKINILDWIKIIQDNGAGEIVLTSINQDGTCKGFDIKLLEKVHHKINIPIIFGGGCGSIEDVVYLIENFSSISGIFINSCFHYYYFKNIFNINNHRDINYINIKKDIGNTDFARNNNNYPKITNGFSIKVLKSELAKRGIKTR